MTRGEVTKLIQFDTKTLFLLTLAVGVVLQVNMFLRELPSEHVFRDAVSVMVGAFIVSVTSTLGAIKKRNLGSTIGTVLGLVLWVFLHGAISVYEMELSPYVGLQILFLVLIALTFNRFLSWDMSRDESEQRDVDPESARRLHSTKQSLKCHLYPSKDQASNSNSDISQ